jgi:hypothetical protein
VLSWRDDQSLQTRGSFRGFEILSRGRGAATLLIDSDDERLPELFIRGGGIYKAQLNTENPLGTMQSIEYALRSLDKALGDERARAARGEKTLGDLEEQAGKSFEHEARLKELLVRQSELNAALDLDKNERQVAPDAGAEGSAEVDLNSGADDGAVGRAARPQRCERGRPNRRGRRDDIDADDNKAAVPGRAVSGPKL